MIIMVVEPVLLILGNPECLGIVLIRASDRKIVVYLYLLMFVLCSCM